MDSLLALAFLACSIWSIIGLIHPKALFFALPQKKKRVHAFFFPQVCALAAAGLGVAQQPNGNWSVAILFIPLAIFYGTRLKRENTKGNALKPSSVQAPRPNPETNESPPSIGVHVTIPRSTSHGYEDSSSSRPQGCPAKWYGPEETVEVKGLILPGMVYVGENLPDQSGYSNDASLINPRLKTIDAKPWHHGEEMGYWPSYSQIPPQCRGAYLKWLATGRSSPKAYIGYVFLFFYGLERRIFHDAIKQQLSASERYAIVGEVKRLLSIYGSNHSFRKYAHNFLAMEEILFSPSESMSDGCDIEGIHSLDLFQVRLAQQVAAKLPLSPSTALQWLALHPEFGLRTPARRCAKEFTELFSRRYVDKFGEGIVVSPNKKTLFISYHAASPSLRGIQLDFSELPDPFMLTAPLRKIHAIAEICTNELDAYSRYLGRKESNPTSLAALALLPKDLILSIPSTKKIKDILSVITAHGPGLLETARLYAMVGDDLPAQINKKDAENLAELVEKMGFGLIPDVRYYGIRPDQNSNVVVFPHGHGLDFNPSGEFRLVGSVIRLGAMVSQSDDNISPHEEGVLRELIQNNRNLTGIEKDSLLAYLHWSLHTPQGTTGVKQKLAELGVSEKTTISRILVTVAHADGHIDPREIKQLEKLYTSLGLDRSQVTRDIHATNTDAPVTVALREKDVTHTIPQPADSSPAFALNEELIRIKEHETRQVRDVLENIFVEQVEESISIDISAQSAPPASPLSGLDPAHQTLLNRLTEQNHWERSTIYELCKELGLMPDGAMEVLNEWAFDNVNAPLFDDGDPIYFDTELAKEIINA